MGSGREYCPHGKAAPALPTKTELGPPHDCPWAWLAEPAPDQHLWEIKKHPQF